MRVSTKYTSIQYEMMKNEHDKLVNKILELEKEVRNLHIEKNKISQELSTYKKQSKKEPKLEQTKKVFDTLSELINKKESCSYRYLIYDLLNFDKSAYSELINGMTVTNFLVECFDEGKYHD